MRNPYEVLGVREGASIDEIKKAYKELVKKYHPDQYRDNPLSDLAEEKLKEINQAYDYLMKQYEKNGTQNSNHQYSNNRSSYSSNSSYGNDSSLFSQIRMNIMNGNIQAAESLLNKVSTRNAEWYYLRGLVYMRKGWYNEAVNSINTAVNMDPSNMEYRDALNRIAFANNRYQNYSYNRRYSSGGTDICSICECLICSDCCCECMGGDLISCI
ncbi:J domain-containing protein [Lutispora thermophila]|uniref:Molecular chaperone DnaJ n=1 Tax=Lutispora thermophila DSM 19022 TaxID=1122184 RepID=A0A1M6FTZ7_9FIRM|nr:J domain-containing protein [Lutispora thermophila]SHJ01158.1 molecular chaperone DnaJ [Lutispora thermophila DSM 19022]